MLEVGFLEHPPNVKEAVHLYEESASMGNKDGIFNLALTYQNGVHVKIDEMKAVDLFKRAANMGHINSQNYLIQLGIAKDKFEFVSPDSLEQYSSDEEYEEEESEDEKDDTITNRNNNKFEIFEEREGDSDNKDNNKVRFEY
jgi:hypothetical protein